MLRGLLGHALGRRLDTLVPARFDAPSGCSHAIDYTHPGGPTLRVRLQELFGLDTTPAVMAGAVPLRLELLAPNDRPAQITDDLPGFWRGSYAAVRKDLRGRYPKHSWPETPWTATPEAKGGRRR